MPRARHYRRSKPRARHVRRSKLGAARPLLAAGGVLASALLVAGAGTAPAEPTPLRVTPTATRALETTVAPTVEDDARDDARAARVAITAVGGMSALSIDRGPGGGHLTRVLLPSGDEAYIIEDPTFSVRSIRVVAGGALPTLFGSRGQPA